MKLDPEIVSYGKAHSKSYHSFYAAVRRYDRIAVFRHIKPDYDAMGTQMGLVTFLKDNFPNKEVHFLGDNHVTFTGRLFPETEKLSDTWFDTPFLAIVVDVGDHDRIADPRYAKAKFICKVDHHPCKAEIAKQPILDLDSAAAAEIMTDLLANWKGTHISKEAAQYLYIGLVGDSGRFMYSSTTAHTFACAQTLLNTGIDIRTIYLTMYEKKLDDLKVTAYILSHFSVSPHGIAYYLLPAKVQEDLKITPERGKENVNLFSNIEGINAWCSITEDPNPKDWCWRISIRSKMKDISGVAFKWGGGGHAQASGAKIKDLTELDAFISDLDKLFE
jgi:phosphoesterase RecJ-like protein